MRIDTGKVDKFLDSFQLETYKKRKNELYNLLDQEKMNGWLNPDLSFLDDIFKVRDRVLNNSKCLVVVGIGGSFLGSCALYEMFTPYFKKNKFPIIFAGTTLSSNYMNELLEYLETIDFSLNVISKSGTTMETMLTYKAIKEVMKKKYSSLEMRKRIIFTTDPLEGTLRKEALEQGYDTFEIADNIGGRYSLLTAAHLFPLSFCLDIKELIVGYKEGLRKREEAFSYAVIRRGLFDKEKYVENFVSYENNWYYYLEWLKQLFGESEGKNGKGILPISMIYTRDLHSLGQFVQDGNKIMFETFFKIKQSSECIINGKNLHDINGLVEDSVIKAHFLGDVPCIIIELDELIPKTIGELSSFFFLTAAFSSYLFDVNPFDQPGVEVYKREIKNNL